MISLATFLVSLTPVVVFLLLLIIFDSYKLAPFKLILLTLGVGALSAVAALTVNGLLLEVFAIELQPFSRYVAPLVEELMKALIVFFLIRSRRVGFLVDATIYGVCVGAGFALFENTYYLLNLSSHSVALAIVRGFGTAIMHGSTTAIAAILAKNEFDRNPNQPLRIYLLPLLTAAVIHSIFNHFILPPVWSMLAIIICAPILMYLAFERSDKSIREWLGSGLDRDIELLDLIMTGQLVDSRVGQYLSSLRQHFSSEAVVDMLCLLRIHTELSLNVKGIIMMRQAGFKIPVSDDVKAQFAELHHLETNIGATGKLALQPLMRSSGRELWQLYMLK